MFRRVACRCCISSEYRKTMKTIKVIVLDNDSNNAIYEARKKVYDNFKNGDYGPAESFTNIGGIAFLAINEFLVEIGILEK